MAKYQMNMRYPGQNWSLTFDITDEQGLPRICLSSMTPSERRAIEAFNKRHMEEYGHVREGEMPEIVGRAPGHLS